MAIELVQADVQAYLHNTKYRLGKLEDELTSFSVNYITGKVRSKYDISGWTDATNTPPLILNLMNIWYANLYLRLKSSEEDGFTKYADFLVGLVNDQCQAIVDGDVSLEGQLTDPNSAVGAEPEFFPTNAATTIWQEDHNADGSSGAVGAATQAFTMQMEF